MKSETIAIGMSSAAKSTGAWNRCDVCGRFVSFVDIINGRARRHLVTPGSHYSAEEHETLCRNHIGRHDEN